MLHPSAECRAGRHRVGAEVRPGVFRCSWCGYVAPLVVHQPSVSVDTDRDAKTMAHTASGCCDSATRQVNYPRPTITERHDDIATDFDSRFRAMAHAYAESSPQLIHWKLSGNKLPAVYK